MRIKIGDTLKLSGNITIKIDGEDVTDSQDWSQWRVECFAESGSQRFDMSPVLANGGIEARLTSEQTEQFSAGRKALIDVRLKTSGGDIVSSQTITVTIDDPVSDTPE